jgi:hypothetical protein
MRWIIIVAAACLLVGLALFLFRRPPAKEPDLSPLATSLRERMDTLLNAPSLSSSTIEISVLKSQLNAEIDRVKILAVKLGGSAVTKEPVVGPVTELIAEIPEEKQKIFKDAVQDGLKDVPDTGPRVSSKKLVVTVQIKTQS